MPPVSAFQSLRSIAVGRIFQWHSVSLRFKDQALSLFLKFCEEMLAFWPSISMRNFCLMGSHNVDFTPLFPLYAGRAPGQRWCPEDEAGWFSTIVYNYCTGNVLFWTSSLAWKLQIDFRTLKILHTLQSTVNLLFFNLGFANATSTQAAKDTCRTNFQIYCFILCMCHPNKDQRVLYAFLNILVMTITTNAQNCMQ